MTAMDEDPAAVAVDEVVDYCRTQAGLLSGRIETLSEEADELLATVDAQTSELRSRLEEHGTHTPAPDQPNGTTGPTGDAVDLGELETLQETLEQAHAEIERKQERIETYQTLIANYTDLAAELTTVTDGQRAFERVVAFERTHDPIDSDRATLAAALATTDDDRE